MTVDSVFLVTVLLILPVVLFWAISNVWVGVLQGLGHPDISFMPGFIFFPLGTMLIVGALYLAGVDPNARHAVLAFVASSFVSLVVTRAIGVNFLDPAIRGAKAILEDRSWARLMAPFTVAALLTTISTQVGVLLLR